MSSRSIDFLSISVLCLSSFWVSNYPVTGPAGIASCRTYVAIIQIPPSLSSSICSPGDRSVRFPRLATIRLATDRARALCTSSREKARWAMWRVIMAVWLRRKGYPASVYSESAIPKSHPLPWACNHVRSRWMLMGVLCLGDFDHFNLCRSCR